LLRDVQLVETAQRVLPHVACYRADGTSRHAFPALDTVIVYARVIARGRRYFAGCDRAEKSARNALLCDESSGHRKGAESGSVSDVTLRPVRCERPSRVRAIDALELEAGIKNRDDVISEQFSEMLRKFNRTFLSFYSAV
jgi:hypothetical protein